MHYSSPHREVLFSGASSSQTIDPYLEESRFLVNPLPKRPALQLFYVPSGPDKPTVQELGLGRGSPYGEVAGQVDYR